MRRYLLVLVVLGAVSAMFWPVAANAGVQIQQRDRDCVCDCDEPCDADGDGICDNCDGHLPIGPDADGDGVPNGQDDDYLPPQDGSGAQTGRK